LGGAGEVMADMEAPSGAVSELDIVAIAEEVWSEGVGVGVAKMLMVFCGEPIGGAPRAGEVD
jgi:hypothetical protein